MSKERILDFPSDKLLLSRFFSILDKVITYLFYQPSTKGDITISIQTIIPLITNSILTNIPLITNSILTVIPLIFISSVLWDYSDNFFLKIGIIACLFFLISVISGYNINTVVTLAFGSPIFKNIGGPEKTIYQSSALASKEAIFHIKPKDQDKIIAWWSLKKSIFYDTLKSKYNTVVFNSTDETSEEFKESWNATWKNMLDYSVSGYCLKEVLSEENPDFFFFLNQCFHTIRLLLPFSLIYSVILVSLFIAYLKGMLQLFLVVQIGLLLIFVSIFLFYLHNVYNLYEINLDLDPFQNIPKDVSQKYEKEIIEYKGKTIFLNSIEIKKKYYSYIITSYLRWNSVLVSFNTYYLCISGVITVIIGITLLNINISVILPWLQHFLIGTICIGFSYIFVGYLFFWLLLRVRTFAAPLISAIVLGLSPYLLKILTTGIWDFSEFINTFMAALMVVVGLISSTIADMVKTEVAGEE